MTASAANAAVLLSGAPAKAAGVALFAAIASGVKQLF